ncbi:MAG: hypothetical protein GOVbin1709_59 [Prokaryotic dsDNA virus sp.]|nr:MAG: hypothetical protein GOVbin1709_59 [Prokaryotic dsDNA virus sp.]|tara:strand:+ start:9380 stop:9628 length:249 start_codon:yes stop_codon:yes gene_type:complete
MEYTNIFVPLLVIAISIAGGAILGSLLTFSVVSIEIKDTREELDKFRKLYFAEVDKWKNKYTDNNPEDDRFKTVVFKEDKND